MRASWHFYFTLLSNLVHVLSHIQNSMIYLHMFATMATMFADDNLVTSTFTVCILGIRFKEEFTKI